MRVETRNLLIRNAIGLLLAPILFFYLFRWFERKQVFQPYRHMDTSGADLGRAWEDVYFEASDGTKLNGWYFPADPSGEFKHLAVVLCHGNAGNISHRLEITQALLAVGLNVFVFDYRGYGRSSGTPSEEGTYRDAEAAYRWVGQKGFSANVLAFGESLGGAVAAELALRHPIQGLMMMSTFTSVPDVGREIFPWLPVRQLGRIKYDTVNKLPRLNIPVLIMHSRSDSIIGYDHGKRLYAASNTPKQFWEISGDHNDTFLAGPEPVQQGVLKFLKTLGTEAR